MYFIYIYKIKIDIWILYNGQFLFFHRYHYKLEIQLVANKIFIFLNMETFFLFLNCFVLIYYTYVF